MTDLPESLILNHGFHLSLLPEPGASGLRRRRGESRSRQGCLSFRHPQGGEQTIPSSLMPRRHRHPRKFATSWRARAPNRPAARHRNSPRTSSAKWSATRRSSRSPTSGLIDHCTRIPACVAISAHFFLSSWTVFRNSAGVVICGSAASARSRFFVSGSWSMAVISRRCFSRAGRGTPAGATMRHQTWTS